MGNNLVSLLAALMVFCTVFGVLGAELGRSDVLTVMKESGPASTGLTFIWMPQLYARIAGGRLLAILFFLGLSFAAVSSLISMVELATRVLVDAGLRRTHALVVVLTGGFALGVPSALDLNVLSNQDFVWGVGLIISGAFVAVATLRYGVAKLRTDVLATVTADWRLGRGWDFIIAVLVPLQALALLGWWMYLSASAYAPDSWYHPLEPYSVASCVTQWGLGVGVCVAAGRLLIRRLHAR